MTTICDKCKLGKQNGGMVFSEIFKIDSVNLSFDKNVIKYITIYPGYFIYRGANKDLTSDDKAAYFGSMNTAKNYLSHRKNSHIYGYEVQKQLNLLRFDDIETLSSIIQLIKDDNNLSEYYKNYNINLLRIATRIYTDEKLRRQLYFDHCYQKYGMEKCKQIMYVNEKSIDSIGMMGISHPFNKDVAELRRSGTIKEVDYSIMNNIICELLGSLLYIGVGINGYISDVEDLHKEIAICNPSEYLILRHKEKTLREMFKVSTPQHVKINQINRKKRKLGREIAAFIKK